MPLQRLLLLVLLAAGGRPSLGRPVSPWFVDEDDLEGYDAYVTDPSEMLETVAGAGTPGPEHQATVGTLGPRDPAGPGSPEPAAPEATTGDSAGLEARETTPGKLSTELATWGIPVTPGPPATELGTSIPPTTEAPSTEGAPSTELATTKALPTEPLTTQPAATEALTTKPPTTQTTATEDLTTEPPTTQTAATEALTTELATTTGPPTAPTTTETLSKEPNTTKALSTALLVPSDARGGATVSVRNSSDAFFKRGQGSQGLSPPPSPTRGPDYMPVKHCLLAILILALVATTFLVCTVVLAVRLSRRNHMYHVRSYSPTEMVCISSLLPEGGEGPPAAAANGSLPPAKGPGLKEGRGEDLSGDDLTLRSFLP